MSIEVYYSEERNAKDTPICFQIRDCPLPDYEYFDSISDMMFKGNIEERKKGKDNIIKLLLISNIKYVEVNNEQVDIFIKSDQIERYVDILQIIYEDGITHYKEK